MTNHNTPTFISALVVHTDGSKHYRLLDRDEVNSGLLNELVDGWIEYVPVTPGVHAYCNEVGKLNGLPENRTATILAGRVGVDILVGTVVFLGEGEDGEDGDLPPEWLNLPEGGAI